MLYGLDKKRYAYINESAEKQEAQLLIELLRGFLQDKR
jgi:hypothetical protein